jgi:hypothetical protein
MTLNQFIILNNDNTRKYIGLECSVRRSKVVENISLQERDKEGRVN